MGEATQQPLSTADTREPTAHAGGDGGRADGDRERSPRAKWHGLEEARRANLKSLLTRLVGHTEHLAHVERDIREFECGKVMPPLAPDGTDRPFVEYIKALKQEVAEVKEKKKAVREEILEFASKVIT